MIQLMIHSGGNKENKSHLNNIVISHSSMNANSHSNKILFKVIVRNFD